MITYRYECWKCSEWHTGQAKNNKELAEIRQTIGVRVTTEQPPKRLRVSNSGKLWLIPMPLDYGLVIGASTRYPFILDKWQTAQWEYADHTITEPSDWVSDILLGERS
jgi:hypothetical protein